ncbi:hypothetical protein WG936_05335 [Corynebacterium sp. H127]|uniref:hypothetical protein n=1 Tax=Corynebacterium sp. H127 TaxID=3133418 RepID=UPI0030A54914
MSSASNTEMNQGKKKSCGAATPQEKQVHNDTCTNIVAPSTIDDPDADLTALAEAVGVYSPKVDES